MANYWLFQASPKVFQLRRALQSEALETFVVTSHKHEIEAGDKVILWQSGREAGCYGLATIVSAVGAIEISEAERAFFKTEIDEKSRVKIKVDYNLWNKPITRELLMGNPAFKDLYVGLPGSNFVATKKQYEAIEGLIKIMDVVAESNVSYDTAVLTLPHLPQNLILYGPPGTGKTFQTINYALSIIENRPLEELALENRQELRRRFNEYSVKGQIAFVTFHQSFGYEDFVEGLKPVVLEGGQLHYAIEPGIFKVICQSARQCLLETIFHEQPQEQQQLKFNDLYKAFIKYIKSDDFKYFETQENQHLFLHQVKENGDLAVRPTISYATINIEKSFLRKLYQRFPSAESIHAAYDFIDKNVQGSAQELYLTVYATLMGFEQMYRQQHQELALMDNDAVIELEEMPVLTNHVLAKCKRYVLIVDEINRGNVTSIFGELMTLLEPSKREGCSEMTKVILPYSKKYFAVPPNLYLIGTMNTADRGANMLDIALRRRFAFREVAPDPQVITKIANKSIIQGIDLAILLQTINNRIELLLDRDHCIGHAYFLNIETLDDLKQVFQENILPLLQEYFFDDNAKIGLVLGSYFVREKQKTVAFADFNHPPYAGEWSEKRLYELCPIENLTEEAFIHIYQT